MMYFTYNLSTRKSCISLVCVLCLIVLVIYITSERQLMAFYVEESKIGRNSKFHTARTEPLTKSHPVGESNPDGVGDNRQKDIKTAPIITTSARSSTVKSHSLHLTTVEPPSSSIQSESLLTSTSVRSSTRLHSSQSYTSLLNSTSTMTTSSTSNSEIHTSESSSGRMTSAGHISSESHRTSPVALKNGNKVIHNELNASQDFVPVVIKTKDTIINIKDDTKAPKGVNTSNASYESYNKVHRARIEQIKHVCSDKHLFENTMLKGHSKIIFYKSENYNFSYCKVPKSGSTFWTRAFGILKRGLSYGNFIFKLSRRNVHNTMLQYITNVQNVIKEKSRTILVSRDPYSRLFSAYIDKSYLLLMKSLNFRIRHIQEDYDITNISTCPTDVTFQEFLDWIISQARQGKTLDRHWSPVYSLCRPCEINSFILVKQETFAKDVEFALQQVGVEKDKFDYITQALHDHRAELSLPGIIDTLFLTASNLVTRKCLGYLKFSKRVWVSFQIQGFIDKRKDFPYNKINETRLAYSKYLTDIVLQTLRDFPLRSSQSQHQRYEYLYQAYQTIKPETIRGIQELYKQDFALFGYNTEPPTKYFDTK